MFPPTVVIDAGNPANIGWARSALDGCTLGENGGANLINSDETCDVRHRGQPLGQLACSMRRRVSSIERSPLFAWPLGPKGVYAEPRAPQTHRASDDIRQSSAHCGAHDRETIRGVSRRLFLRQRRLPDRTPLRRGGC